MQLLSRTSRGQYSSDRAAFLLGGIPTVLLTDFDPLRPSRVHHRPDDVAAGVDATRLDRWTEVLTALTLRLDRQGGRPLWEDEYLALFGRVWIRRDMMWIGFVLWVATVLLARPGRWAGAGGSERRSRGRSFVPGYLFRLGFLGTVILSPTVAGAAGLPARAVERVALAVRALALAGLRGLPTAVFMVAVPDPRGLRGRVVEPCRAAGGRHPGGRLHGCLPVVPARAAVVADGA